MAKVKERPILFSGPMVRAILEGQKTVTRRAVKPQYVDGPWSVRPAVEPRHDRHSHDWWLPTAIHPYAALPHCPFGQPGDRLWVRESHAQVFEVDIPEGRPAGPLGTGGSPSRPDWKSRYVYRADGEMPNVQWQYVGDSSPVRWAPSIHMPRTACRILLEVTDVRVERLQAITEEQALAEGVMSAEHDIDPNCNDLSPVELFGGLWVMLNGMGSWNANPWVWVVEFKVLPPSTEEAEWANH